MPDLRDEIARVRAGTGDGRSMIEAFRASVVLLPRQVDGSVLVGDYGGVRWLYAFSTPAELAAWVLTRGGDGTAERLRDSPLNQRYPRNGQRGNRPGSGTWSPRWRAAISTSTPVTRSQ